MIGHSGNDGLGLDPVGSLTARAATAARINAGDAPKFQAVVRVKLQRRGGKNQPVFIKLRIRNLNQRRIA